jgi:hypothetical protein
MRASRRFTERQGTCATTRNAAALSTFYIRTTCGLRAIREVIENTHALDTVAPTSHTPASAICIAPFTVFECWRKNSVAAVRESCRGATGVQHRNSLSPAEIKGGRAAGFMQEVVSARGSKAGASSCISNLTASASRHSCSSCFKRASCAVRAAMLARRSSLTETTTAEARPWGSTQGHCRETPALSCHTRQGVKAWHAAMQLYRNILTAPVHACLKQ